MKNSKSEYDANVNGFIIHKHVTPRIKNKSIRSKIKLVFVVKTVTILISCLAVLDLYNFI